MKQIIAVDVDDVLADSTEFWRKEVNNRVGLNLEREHWRVPGEYSGYYTRLWEAHGIGHLFSVDDIDAFMKHDQSLIWSTESASHVLRKLAEKYELAVVTARNTAQEAATRRWLDEVFPGVFSRVYFTWQPDTETAKNKGEICADIGAKWLIDDSPVHCRDALAHDVQPILYGEYGWHVDIPMGVVHFKSWQEIGSYFDEQGN